MKIFSRDFFDVWLVLFLVATIFSGACTSQKNEPGVAIRMAQQDLPRAVNINTADADTLEKIPSVGPGLAKKIIEHRTRYGAFRRTENLMLIEGVSDRRFREIGHLITVD